MKKISKAGAMLRAAGSAFTLLEVLVAVGAIAVISVGMAAIFQAVGRTVTGAQRVSTMTQYAALIERQLRTDFMRITREGFLVIRNQNTTNTAGQLQQVFQNPDDPTPKVRRIDELLFFTKGEVETSRQPVNAQMVARGTDSMVYYGQGLLPPHRTGQLGDVRPDWTSVNDPALSGLLGQTGFPNAYASNWSLLRRQVLLAQPVASRQALPATGWPSDLAPFARPQAFASPVLDKDSQIACQPAASSIFRSIARVMYDGGNLPGRAHVRWDGPPRLSSGMVDIATSDFGEIRTMVQTFPLYPQNINTRADADQKWLNPGVGPGNGTWAPGNNDAINRMRAWMCDALPTQSDMSSIALNSAADPKGARLRYEDYPPDYLGTVTAANGSVSSLASRRADQLMLAGSKFIPRCTQFSVEWTFNYADPVTGAAVWYGTSLANNNFTQYNNVVAPYPGLPFTVDRRVVYGFPVPGPNVTQTACFGYVDPTYSPRVNNMNDPRSVPWMWPRMVRVTITIADERDPTIEESFQWEFDLPRPPTV
ncbi:MAG: type II secretion system protein [Planctomycetota bacterium]